MNRDDHQGLVFAGPSIQRLSAFNDLLIEHEALPGEPRFYCDLERFEGCARCESGVAEK